MIQAIIFDMDGLLIDSEPLWEEAELEVFNQVGVPLTSEMTKQTMGLRVDEVVQHWFDLYPWKDISHKEIEAKIVEKVIALIKEKGTAKEGVNEMIRFFKDKNMPMAIASSSSMDIIETVVKKLHIKNNLDVIYSAEHEQYGKPHPGVYITAAQKLGIASEKCLAFEDSPNGVLAAKAAKMKCVAVPDQKMKNDRRFGIADIILDSLSEFNLELLNKL